MSRIRIGLTAAALLAGAGGALLVTSPWGYVVMGTLVALPISLALGRGRLRRLALALAGLALVGVLYVYALAAGCPPDARECVPELSLAIGGFVFAGWLVGMAVAAVIGWTCSASR